MRRGTRRREGWLLALRARKFVLRLPAFSCFAALLALVFCLPACSHLAYYAQAVRGHLELMQAAVPLAEAQRAADDPLLQQALGEVLAIRDFASRELALPDNGSYRAYAELGRPYVVWNVFAASEFSLEARQWCFLVVGCVSYRGYYRQQDAERLAAELRREGYHTYVAGVPAYSTLGHLDDPVLNTFLRYGTLEIARIIFHELAHHVVFLGNDTAFNESFATVVENEGMRRWLSRHATVAQQAAHAAQRAQKAAFLSLLRTYRERLADLYGRVLPADAMRIERERVFAELRGDYACVRNGCVGQRGEMAAGAHACPAPCRTYAREASACAQQRWAATKPPAERAAWAAVASAGAGYDAFFDSGLNNARLASVALYEDLVPAFEALLAEEGYDLRKFYARVAALAGLRDDERRSVLTRLAGSHGGDPPCHKTSTEVASLG